VRLYQFVNGREDLHAEAKAELVKLQQGDAGNLAIWKQFIELSQAEFNRIYDRLGIRFDHLHGESFYNAALPDIVEDLKKRGLATLSDGAWCVFLDEPGLPKTPFIVQKSDGAFNYATTDLDKVELRHIAFGSVLGEDGKLLRTRTGDTVRLGDLLDEAEVRALAVVTEKNPGLPEDTRRQIARAVGIGAVKYADLSQNRTTDYVFSWSKMLAMTGNTAPYMQYAYVRVQSIFRKAGDSATGTILLDHPAELDLAKHLLRFAETLQAVMDDDKPNWLTGYLYDLTGKFSTFYENCPVLQSAEPTRSSRLALCRLTADVIKQGLNLLGIDVIEQM
jgi:arginyl-tRNA synthetase